MYIRQTQKGEKALFVVLSAANPDPMYKQVTDQIRDAIVGGTLAPEARLPSIREMARTLGLSPITIRRAYSDLERQGWIVTRAGLGSLVAGMSRDELREKKAREIRGEIARVTRSARAFGMTTAEIKRVVDETKERRRSR